MGAYILALLGSFCLPINEAMKFNFSYSICYAISKNLDLSHGVASFSAAHIASCFGQHHMTVTELPVLWFYYM